MYSYICPYLIAQYNGEAPGARRKAPGSRRKFFFVNGNVIGGSIFAGPARIIFAKCIVNGVNNGHRYFTSGPSADFPLFPSSMVQQWWIPIQNPFLCGFSCNNVHGLVKSRQWHRQWLWSMVVNVRVLLAMNYQSQ